MEGKDGVSQQRKKDVAGPDAMDGQLASWFGGLD